MVRFHPWVVLGSRSIRAIRIFKLWLYKKLWQAAAWHNSKFHHQKGSDFDNYTIKIKALLGAHDIWEVIGKDYNEPEVKDFLTQQQNNSLKASRKRDKKVLFIIYQALDDDGFEMILSATSTKEAWEKL